MRFFLLKCISILLSMSLLIGCDRLNDIPAGHGYSAHDLCARVLLAKDEETVVWEKYVKPVVIPLNIIGLRNIDRINQVVTSTNRPRLPINIGGEATSVYREGLGCTNLIDLTVEELQAQKIIPYPKPLITLPEFTKWPHGSGGPSESIPDDIDLDKVNEAFSLLFQEENKHTQKPDNTLATLVAYNGELIAEQYVKNQYKNLYLPGWSMTKTITGLLTGIMYDDGLINLQETANYRWYGTEKADITVENVMHMASGLKWDEGYGGDSDATRMQYQSSSMTEYVATLPKSNKPGDVFNYSTGDAQLLSELVHRRAGDSMQDAYDFYQSRLFYPLGIDGLIEPDETGVLVGGSHAHMKPRDWLKLGQLILQRGMWNGEQIVSEDWIDFISTPSPAAKQYGGQVWLYDEVKMADYNIPKDVVFFRGFKGQLMAVLPSHNAVFLKMAVSHRDGVEMRKEYYKALSMIIDALPIQ